MPAASSVEPGESSLRGCSGDSPSLLLSSSKAKASAGLGKLPWEPAGRGAMVRGDGWRREGPGEPRGVPLCCAHLLRTWPWAQGGESRTPPAVRSREQNVPPPGEEVAPAPLPRSTFLGRGSGGVPGAWLVGERLLAAVWSWPRSGSAVLPHHRAEMGRGALESPSPSAERPDCKPAPRVGPCPQQNRG